MPAAERWIDWRIDRIWGEAAGDGLIGDTRATIAIGASGALDIDRPGAVATFTAPRAPSASEVVHPYLGAVAAVVARWLGHQSFHCGGLLVDGAAWGVLGGRGHGKSTLLANFEKRGVSVLSDDLLVVRDLTALAGPRCVDLRADAAAALILGESIGVVGARERWRLALGQVPPEAPLAGWIVLRWADRVAVRAVAPAERLPALLENVTIVPTPPNPTELLDLAALPMLAFERARAFATIDEAGETLLSALRGVRAEAG